MKKLKPSLIGLARILFPALSIGFLLFACSHPLSDWEYQSAALKAGKTYTITYDGNGNDGGKVPLDLSTYSPDTLIVLPANSGGLIKAGYAFAGWKKSTSTLIYQAGDHFSMDYADIKISAYWLPGYALTYNGNGNDGGHAPVDNLYHYSGELVTLYGNSGGLTKAGSAFAGWRELGGSTTYPGGGNLVMGSTAMALYAYWLPGFTLTYSGNGNTGGTVPFDSRNHYAGELVTLLDNYSNLSKSGLTFGGWITGSGGTGTAYRPGSAYRMGSVNQTIYAWWIHYIATVAGIDTESAATGDGGPATLANLYGPHGIAVDGVGNLYIADSYNNRIRKVDTSGIISTLAGTGSAGSSGDGAAATSAKLYNPYGIAVDTSGNIYIADTNNNRIRKVATNGIITTVAGTGTAGSTGDGAAAILATLYSPRGVAVDASGNLYIADSSNHRIRKVDTSGKITTVAGTGSYGFSGDGIAANIAQINYPCGIAVDVSGRLYIADSGNNRIRRISTGGIITTVAGTGSAGSTGDGSSAILAKIYANNIALGTAGNFYITDNYNGIIRMVDIDGNISTVAGTTASISVGDQSLINSAKLYNPDGIAVDASGNLYIADSAISRIGMLSPNH